MQRRAAEQNELLRHAWLLKLATWTAEQLIFIDKSAANERSMDCKYGWAPLGVTPHIYASIKRSERWSILPVYTIDGYVNWEVIQGSYDKELFNNFVHNKVIPLTTLYPGVQSILIMDNAKIHHSDVYSMSLSVLLMI